VKSRRQEETPAETGQEALKHRLREADAETLLALVKEHAPSLEVPEARQVLRNPFADREVIEVLLDLPRLLTATEVRSALARHPRTPQPHALRFVAGLYWRDLVSLAIDTRVRPAVRRAAERALQSRLAGMALGEKMAIARRGSPGILADLRRDPNPRVMQALLENPRVTEGVLMPMIQDDRAEPAVLQVIAKDRRWGVRYEIRLGLAKNPRTPVQTALGVLPHLKKKDLRTVARANRVREPVRRRARVLLGEA
jgi:hypothetical protein